MKVPSDLARRVKLVLFDVDGVLTDAGVYLGRTAEGSAVELKRFDIQDGLGIKMLEWAGLEVALVSGRKSEATTLRAEELGVEALQVSDGRKMPVVTALLDRVSVGWDETAMLADDLPDLAVFEKVGLRAAVANAQPEVVAQAHWQSEAPGGRGAVREFCRSLLTARGEWDEQVERYVDERRGSDGD